MIDWSRPVAEIIGSPPAKYEQGGKQYRADGTEINPKPEPVLEQKPAEVASLNEAIKEELDLGLTHTEIASKYSITRQKVTYIARQLS